MPNCDTSRVEDTLPSHLITHIHSLFDGWRKDVFLSLPIDIRIDYRVTGAGPALRTSCTFLLSIPGSPRCLPCVYLWKQTDLHHVSARGSRKQVTYSLTPCSRRTLIFCHYSHSWRVSHERSLPVSSSFSPCRRFLGLLCALRSDVWEGISPYDWMPVLR